MTCDYITARDEMYAVIKAANDSQIAIGYVPEMRFKGVELKDPAPTGQFWMHVATNTIDSPQKAIAHNIQGPDKRSYSTIGLLRIELYIPRIPGGWDQGCEWAIAIQSAFRGVKTPNGVWFKNAVIREADNESEFKRINVIVEFYYTEIY